MTNPIQKFWSQVDRSQGEDACWPWLGPIHKMGGHGQTTWNGGTVGAHVVAWFLTQGLRKAPKGMVVRHKCDNAPCCNPTHLIIGTPKQNAEDKVERNRQTKGVDHPRSVLTPEEVLFIYRSPLDPDTLVSKYFEGRITAHAIRSIKAGRSWWHITGAPRPQAPPPLPKPPTKHKPNSRLSAALKKPR